MDQKKKYLLYNTIKKNLYIRDKSAPRPSIIDPKLVEKNKQGMVKRVKFECLKYDRDSFYINNQLSTK